MHKADKITLPENFSQNNKLPIRIVAPNFGHLGADEVKKYGMTQRLPYYFFLFVLDGSTRYSVDLEEVTVNKGELFFSLPYQAQQSPSMHNRDYYKLGFDNECLSLLPRQYPFLLNPLNKRKILFTGEAAIRLTAIFKILLSLLKHPDADPGLILAHLNCLLMEVDISYFLGHSKPTDTTRSKFTEFKIFVENNLTAHPSIKEIAEKLAMSTDSLYQIVKQHSGLSPKEYMMERLIQEARRHLYYGKRLSVKELAFELGFNDPAYFSRLFKKATGKTVLQFFQDLS